MIGPSWLDGAFAALMIVVAFCGGWRLVVARRRHWNNEPAVDGLHILMGTAMAGMFEPQISLVPDTVWRAVFVVAAGWFAWQAIRARALGAPGHSRVAHPLPHVVESAAMIYMLQPGAWLAHPAAGMAMTAMSGPAGASTRNPIVPLALALFLLGYIIWTADGLTGAGQALAPRLAASYKIVMGIAMGYMLVAML